MEAAIEVGFKFKRTGSRVGSLEFVETNLLEIRRVLAVFRMGRYFRARIRY